jgi:hypothetical protein
MANGLPPTSGLARAFSAVLIISLVLPVPADPTARSTFKSSI